MTDQELESALLSMAAAGERMYWPEREISHASGSRVRQAKLALLGYDDYRDTERYTVVAWVYQTWHIL